MYVDYIIYLANDPKEDMDALNYTYRFKQESVGTPEIYLGANVQKFQVNNGKEC